MLAAPTAYTGPTTWEWHSVHEARVVAICPQPSQGEWQMLMEEQWRRHIERTKRARVTTLRIMPLGFHVFWAS